MSLVRHFLEILAVSMDRCFINTGPFKHRSRFDARSPRSGKEIKPGLIFEDIR